MGFGDRIEHKSSQRFRNRTCLSSQFFLDVAELVRGAGEASKNKMLPELIAQFFQVRTVGARANVETIPKDFGRALSKLHASPRP